MKTQRFAYPKVGILGGSFNPIHLGHLQVAQDALEENGLDQVLFIPAGQPNFKNPKGLVDKYERLKMVELAIEENPYFQLSSYEVEKSSFSYTIETIEHLRAQDQEIQYFFICGEDAFFSIDQWYRSQDLKGQVEFLLARRSEDLKDEDLDAFRSRGYKVQLFDSVFLDLSSTLIRKRIRAGRSCSYLLPPRVEAYIKERGFYLE